MMGVTFAAIEADENIANRHAGCVEAHSPIFSAIIGAN